MKLITAEALGNGAVEVKISGRKPDCSAFSADENEEGRPMPSEMVCASLGACIVLMLDAYCCRMGYKDGRSSACLTYTMTGSHKHIEVITIDIELPKDFPAEKREAALRIARSCPIHTTLSVPTNIDIDIAG